MSTLVFNTLQYVKKLRDAEVPDKQAEAQVEMMANIIEEQLATKLDLDTKLAKLKHALEIKIHSEIRSVESRLLTWFLGALFAQGALVVGCIKFIIH